MNMEDLLSEYIKVHLERVVLHGAVLSPDCGEGRSSEVYIISLLPNDLA